MEREKLYRLLRLGLEKGASDIHFQVGYLPKEGILCNAEDCYTQSKILHNNFCYNFVFLDRD